MSNCEQGAAAHAPTNGDTVSDTKVQAPADSAPMNPQTELTSTTNPIELELPKSAADGLIQKPFARPLDTAKPVAREELTPEQQSKYEAVLKSASSWTTVATKAEKNAPTSPITEDERMWLTRDCLLRYLRATKWDVSHAETRLQSTLTWRREYDLKKFTPEYISIENETGKQVLLGYDIHARPCLYLLPSNQNTEKSHRQLEHLVFMLERAIDLSGPGQETVTLIVDFKETTSGQNASLSQAKQTLSFLQNHYPERLGRALVLNVPFIIRGFFKLITPFIDPNTHQKLRFNEDLRQHVPPSQLMKSVGGDVEFRYDHASYWPTLNQLADQRREAYRERWVQGGKQVGEFENYLKGENVANLSQTQLEAKASEQA
ncbi:hypothetical protein PEX1_060310 [Penicillium expansum]|uniref:CRAL-TRIO domain-containing protein n=1 Tax=Penicillium expansum TaxID=27334 RepID=A0A0A2JPH1_PENEN|nr:hypothetical protein PEX2_097060 [Penicillium expansum]KGO45243.1 hypothetical protein PEXP_060320 [Penicillium expansum]KGO56548.1 hypothetical protein PEX2_097060 [Penicillium expansum]KGO72314.1 hypothetical protein PEX1_060310 [Penicillium expansum]